MSQASETNFRSVLPFSIYATLLDGKGSLIGKTEPSCDVKIPPCKTWRAVAFIENDYDLARYAAEIDGRGIPVVVLTGSHDRLVGMRDQALVVEARIHKFEHTQAISLGYPPPEPRDGTHLVICDCERVTDRGILRLNGMKSVSRISIQNCPAMRAPCFIGLENLVCVAALDCPDCREFFVERNAQVASCNAKLNGITFHVG